MDFEEIRRMDEAYHADTFSRLPVAFVGGKNATLFGADGKEYTEDRKSVV